MILVKNKEEDYRLMKYYYKNGLKWIFADTFEKYISKTTTDYYYVWDLESLKEVGKYILANDTWEMTVDEYFNKIRKQKLKRILNE